MEKVTMYWWTPNEKKPKESSKKDAFADYSVRVLVITKNGNVTFGRYGFKAKKWIAQGLSTNNPGHEVIMWAHLQFAKEKLTKQMKMALKIYGLKEPKIEV